MYQAPRRPAYRQSISSRRDTTATSLPKGKSKAIIVVLALLVVVGGTFVIFSGRRHKPTPHTASPTSDQTVAGSQTNTGSNGFNKHAHSLTDPSSIWVIVNKQHALNPQTYTPATLVVPNIPLRSNITGTEKYVRSDMAQALQTMVQAAAAQGVHLNLQSGYRSYNFQVTLYNGYVRQQGQAVADTQSARPGYSEHQTGLAADLGGTTQPSCNVEQCFATTPEGTWLAANAYKFGFIIRYPQDKVSVTGYEYEPWHVRYVGADLSAEMHAKGIETLEEFFGVTGGSSY